MELRGLDRFYALVLKFHLPRKVLLLFILYFILNKIEGVAVRPEIRHFLGLFAFFFAYISIYLMNDFVDAEEDSRRSNLAYSKPIVTSSADPATFAYLSYFHAVLGLLFAIFFSKQLAILTALTLLAAHVRHVVKNLAARTALLAILEFFNFLSILAAISPDLLLSFNTLKAIGVFVTFYSLIYAGYRRSRALWGFVAAAAFISFLIIPFVGPRLWVLVFALILFAYSFISGFLFSLKKLELTENAIALAQIAGIIIFYALTFL